MSSAKKHVEIRRLRAADARSYRAVLVEALIVHPECFPEDYNIQISRSLSEIERELERSGTFGEWLGGSPGGNWIEHRVQAERNEGTAGEF